MRVIALGGAGMMGRFAVRDLAAKEVVEELVIADRDLAAAQLPPARYCAEGTAREGFHEYLSPQNPNDKAVKVAVHRMTGEGPRISFVLEVPCAAGPCFACER